MKKISSLVIITILLIFKAITSIASPAYPGLAKMKQPDGTYISLYLKGDERIRWMESEDGYSLLYDNNQNIVYAVYDDQAGMIPSSVKAQDISQRSSTDKSFLSNIPKKLFYSKPQINTLNSIFELKEKTINNNSNLLRSYVGVARGICTLVEFPNKSLVKTKAEFNNLMNQVGYNASSARGSVCDYYLENSYGKLNLIITVAGPYKLSKNWEYYGEDDPKTKLEYLDRLQEFAKEAAQFTFTDPNINPADYDVDGDGYIDSFHIIYAGYGQEAGGGVNAIWAHKFGFNTITFGTKKLNSYSCSPELRSNSGTNITNIGVVCHEMCHIFGSPDFYDVDYSDYGEFTGTGKWDLMGTGCWNNEGITPAHINMYQKIQLGWVIPVVLNQPQIITGMQNSTMNPVAYRYNTATANEYYILENRQKTGFDQEVPGSGLLIYHVSITDNDIWNNEVNIKHPQKMYIVCASATSNPNGTPSSYGIINAAGCPFPGTSKKTSFTDKTTPSANSWNGTNTVKPLTEIQEQSGLISFRFMDMPVQNLEAKNVNNNNDIELNWKFPFMNDWVSYANTLWGNIYYSGNQFTAAVKFTAQDMQIFNGSKLTKVFFYINNISCKHTIQVWFSEQGVNPSGDPILSQAINNPTKGNIEINLTAPVPLTANKDLWIGIKYELSPMTYVAAIDNGPKAPNRNYVFRNNIWYMTSPEDDFNWYIFGYLQFDNNASKAPADTWLRSATETAKANNYNIYRDNIKIASTTQFQYIDVKPAYGTHIYSVALAYENGKESERVHVDAYSSYNTNIQSVLFEDEINIYPNPIEKGETLVINCEKYLSSTLSLFNISGQLLLKEKITEPVIYKKMDFEPGTYILQIKNETNSFVKKIIIK